ncbi:hypothetical protein G8C15_17225 [Enterococcus casseliflavus]|nr:hypothetical protein [Enterococcus casseliflavus]MBF0014421.1 hypothetical protein [Enterococcus casseliflavus]
MISDEILALLFTRAQYQKLVVFYELYSREIHYSEIEVKFGESKRGIRRTLKSLSMDILEYHNKKNINLQIISDKEKFYFSEQIGDEEYMHLKYFLQEKYLQTSGLYNSLLYILERRKFSLLSLTKHLSYSESYIYKLLKKINEFYKKTNLGIEIVKGFESKYILEGDELTIRMFHYFLMNISLTKDTWRLKTIEEHQIELINSAVKSKRTEYLTPTNLKRVYILIAIHEISLKNGKRARPLPDSLVRIGRLMNKESEIPKYIKNQHERKLGHTKYLQNELIQLVFLLNYFCQELRTNEEKISIGKELVNNIKNPVIRPCVKLLNELTSIYKFEKDLYYFLVYSLCNRLIVVHYLGVFKFLTLVDSTHELNEVENNIQNMIEKHFEDYKHELSFPSLSKNYIQLLISYIKLSEKSTLKVYIEIQHRPEHKVILENEIKLNYNTKILKIVEDFSEADVVVADTYFQTNSNFFYLRNIFDPELWINLTNFIDINLKRMGII